MTQQVYLDDDFPTHPKIVQAGGDAAWLYVCALAYASRHLTRGLIPKAVVRQLSDRRNPLNLAKRLVDVGLWHDTGTDYRINDYEVRNAKQIARRENAQHAARTRWTNARSNATASLEHVPKPCDSNAIDPRNQGTKSSSASGDTHDPPDEHADDETFGQALAIIADRRLAAATNVRNPAGYRRTVLAELRKELLPRLISDPNLGSLGSCNTAQELADKLEPPTKPPVHPYDVQRPNCDLCDSTGMVELVPGIASRCTNCNPVTP